MIEIRNLTKIYPATGISPMVRALDHVNLTIDTGDIFGIIGLSGAGKKHSDPLHQLAGTADRR